LPGSGAWVSLKYGRSEEIVAATSRRRYTFSCACYTLPCVQGLRERRGTTPEEWDLR
jgi:hypothetical protein